MAEGCRWVELGWGGWGEAGLFAQPLGALGLGGMSTPAFWRHYSRSICTPVFVLRCSVRRTSPACRRCFESFQCWPPPPPSSCSLDSIPVSITLKSLFLPLKIVRNHQLQHKETGSEMVSGVTLNSKPWVVICWNGVIIKMICDQHCWSNNLMWYPIWRKLVIFERESR